TTSGTHTASVGNTMRSGMRYSYRSTTDTATNIANSTSTGATTHVTPKLATAAANRAAVTSSTAGYAAVTGSSQWRQRPRATAHDTTGIRSRAPSEVSQCGQRG